MSDVTNPHQLDKQDLIEAATRLWGKPTRRGRNEWRFGAKGSKSIRLDKLVWRDHETGDDGGIVKLCRLAGINGNYHESTTVKEQKQQDWQPSLTPPGPAPINKLTCDKLYTYRAANGDATHYVRRFEQPRKFWPLTWGTLDGVTDWHARAPRPPLPLYRLDGLHELNPELVILAEGEKAADAANERIAAENLPWLAMSWSGGAGRAKDADVSALKGRKVVIWPDADTAGSQARDVLLEMIPGATALNTADLDQIKWGFDAADLGPEDKIKDFVEARMKGPDPSTDQTTPPPGPGSQTSTGTGGGIGPSAPQPLPPDITIDDFYAFLPKHWYLYVPTQTLWPPATISSRLGKKDGMKPARWLDKNRAVSQMIWAPGEPQIIRNKHLIEAGWRSKPGAVVFNQYRQPVLTGGNPAGAEPWLDLVKFLYPNQMEHEHIITVLAHKLQHPEIKINHAIVIGGGMRIGKDTILEPIKRALGEWNCVEAKPTTIMSSFNGYMKSILLMINEARDLGETKRQEFYLHMKDVITAPPRTVRINEKHEKETHSRNVCLVIMTTNHRTDGIYLPPTDGRHFPVWSDRAREDYDIDFFDKHYDWLDNGGAEHVAAYLLGLDVSHFRPGRPPPRTNLFHEIIAASRPTETSWIEDILAKWTEDRGSPPTVFVLQSIINRATDTTARDWLTNAGNRRFLPYRFEECGYTRIPNTGHASGRWRVSGTMQIVYGNIHLTPEERTRMAQELETGGTGPP